MHQSFARSKDQKASASLPPMQEAAAQVEPAMLHCTWRLRFHSNPKSALRPRAAQHALGRKGGTAKSPGPPCSRPEPMPRLSDGQTATHGSNVFDILRHANGRMQQLPTEKRRMTTTQVAPGQEASPKLAPYSGCQVT